METLWQDLRYGFRMLARNPGFTVVAVLTLALGIGANTAIFSVVNAVLLQPLPFRDPDRLIIVNETARRGTVQLRPVSYPDFLDWSEQSQTFEELAAFSPNNYTLTGDGEAERVVGELVSASYFPLLGIQAAYGRTFLSEEVRLPEGELVAVISHALWQRRFNSDPQVVGGSILLDGRSYTIVGTTPQGFDGIQGGAELWTPITVLPPSFTHFLRLRGARWHAVVGQLKKGVSLDEAQAEMDTIASRLEEQYSNTNADRGVQLVTLAESLVGDLQRPLLVLFSAIGFVLLIVCANMANLLLARATSRQKELAIRAALGAGRLRLIRQLLTESVLLSVAGGVLGILLALWGVDLLLGLVEGIPAFVEVSIDLWVLGFALLLSFVTGLVFGLAPASQLSKGDMHEALKEGGRNPGAGSGRRRFRSLLVVAELALALVLLIGAGLMLRSFEHLLSVDPGFDPRHALTARVDLPDQNYSIAATITFARQLLERIEAVPGVRIASASSDLPLSIFWSANFMEIEGRPEGRENRPRVYRHYGTGKFFRALGVPLVQGRTFTARDTFDTLPVIVVSESAARRFWPGEDPIGKRLRIRRPDIDSPWRTVVGVVRDVRYRALARGPDNDPDIYLPLGQSREPNPSLYITVRTSGDPAALAPSLRSIVRDLDLDLALYGVSTLSQQVSDSTVQDRITAFLLSAFALAALGLAAIGIYGVISYSVSQRMHEIGIRMALGAQPRDIFKLVVGQGMVLTLIGVGVGLVGAFALTRFLESLLFGVSATDPATFAGVSVLLAAVALLACYIPARRATKVDPLVALCYE